MSDLRRASTGSMALDGSEQSIEGVLEHTQEHVQIPGTVRQQRIVLDGISYAHVAEDADGRWIYRPV